MNKTTLQTTLSLALLLAGCAQPPPQNAQSNPDSLEAVTRQIQAHDAKATALGDQLQFALNVAPGQTRQQSVPTSLPPGSYERIQTLRDQAAQRFPSLLEKTTWIGESSQLVSPGQQNSVTASLTTLYVIVTTDPLDPGNTVWVATVTANPDTGAVYDTKLAATLKGKYVPAWQLAADNNGHINATRRVTTDPAFQNLSVHAAPMLEQSTLAVFKTPSEALVKVNQTPQQDFAKQQKSGSEYAVSRALSADGVVTTKEGTVLLMKSGLSAQSLSSLSLGAQRLISAAGPNALLHGLSTNVTVRAVPASLDELTHASVRIITALNAEKLEFTLTVGEGLINIGATNPAQESAVRAAVQGSGVDPAWVNVTPSRPFSPTFSWGGGGGSGTPPPPPENLRTRIEPLAGGAQFTQINNVSTCSLGYSGIRIAPGYDRMPGFSTARHCYSDREQPARLVYHPSANSSDRKYVGYFTNEKSQGADSEFLLRGPNSAPFSAYVAVANHNTRDLIKRIPQVYRPSEVYPTGDVRLSGRSSGARVWRYIDDYNSRQPVYVSSALPNSNYYLSWTPMCVTFLPQQQTSGALDSMPQSGDSGGTIYTGSEQANLLGTMSGGLPLPGAGYGAGAVCWTTVDQQWQTLGISPYAY